MARYAIGIDLGTTHCAVSYFNLEEGKPRGAAQADAAHPAADGARARWRRDRCCPRSSTCPARRSSPRAAWRCRGTGTRRTIAGEFARTHGAKVPTRLVSSAKSWLCHPGVDRRARDPAVAGAAEDVQRISPAGGLGALPAHLREAWDHVRPGRREDAARLAAAGRDRHRPGLVRRRGARPDRRGGARRRAWRTSRCSRSRRPRSTPGSRRTGEGFRKQVKSGEVILVVDVGGGTSDFSLIAVARAERRAGARARWPWATTSCSAATTWTWRWPTRSAQKLAAEGKKLDAWQFNALTHGCRRRRRRCSRTRSWPRRPSRSPGRGSSLIGGTLRTELAARGAGPRCSPMASSRRSPVDGAAAHRAPHRPGADGAALRAGRRRSPSTWPRSSPGRRRRSRSRRTRRSARAAGVRPPHRGALQRRRLQGRAAQGPGAGGARTRWLAADGGAAGQGAGRRGPGPRRGARRGVLRLGAAGARPAHPRRHRARLLRGRGDGDARGARAWSRR